MTVKFSDFIVAAQQARGLEDVELIYQNEHVVPVNDKYVHDATDQIREATWKAFEKALEIFPKQRREYISKRYGFEWEKMATNKHPFLVRYVDLFGAGAGIPRKKDLKNYEKKTKLSDLSPPELKKLYVEATANRYVNLADTSMDLRGGPHKMHQYFVRDAHLDDQKIQILTHDLDKLPIIHPDAFRQRLAMAIVNGHEMDKGTILQAPTESGEVDYYEVWTNITGAGLYAVALRSISKDSTLPPMVIFCPTRTSLAAIDSIDSLRNNAQENNGELGFKAVETVWKEKGKKGIFELLLNDPKFTRGKKPEAIAYSMAGSQLGYVLDEYWDKFSAAYFYNTVSNSDASVAERVATSINNCSETIIPPSIFIDRIVVTEDGSKGDWAHYLGKKHIGWGITNPRCLVQLREWVTDKPEPKNFSQWSDLHSERFLESPKAYKCKVYRGPTLLNRKLDNSQRGPHVKKFEDFRYAIGPKILDKFLQHFSRFFSLILRCLGIQLLRNSKK